MQASCAHSPQVPAACQAAVLHRRSREVVRPHTASPGFAAAAAAPAKPFADELLPGWTCPLHGGAPATSSCLTTGPLRIQMAILVGNLCDRGISWSQCRTHRGPCWMAGCVMGGNQPWASAGGAWSQMAILDSKPNRRLQQPWARAEGA